MGLPTVVLPFACLPNVEFLCWMAHAPQILIEIQETFPKQTCRNRYAIMSAAGPMVLTIPVKRPMGNHTRIKDVLLEDPSKWVNLHWRAIESAYNKSPFFLYYRDAYESIFRNPPEKLTDLNRQFLNLTLKFCGLIPTWSFTDAFNKTYPDDIADMRQLIMPKHPQIHRYSIGEYKHYVQVFSTTQPFIPNLSALDLLFNLGPESNDYLRKHHPGK